METSFISHLFMFALEFWVYGVFFGVLFAMLRRL
jgi:hypothetical protein